jgi:hypothetical protein
MAGWLDVLDDPDYPAYTTGRARELVGQGHTLAAGRAGPLARPAAGRGAA